MIITCQEDVTEAVLDAMRGASNERLVTVMAALVRHMHAFAREVRLTEAEFEFGIDFLNRIGQATNDTHNEGSCSRDAVGLLDAGLPAQQRRRTAPPKRRPRCSGRSGA